MKKLDEFLFNINISDFQSKNFYYLIEENYALFLKIYKSLKNYSKKKKNLNKYFNHILEHISIDKFFFLKTKVIKNEMDFCFSLISASVLWSLNETNKICLNNKKISSPYDSYDFINEIREFIEIFKIWSVGNSSDLLLNSITEKDHNNSIFRIMTILIDKKILLTKNVYSQKNKKNKTYYECSEFTHVKILKIFTSSLRYLKVEDEFILFGNHYSSSWKLFIPNTYSNESFKILDDDILKIKLKLFTNIDFENYKEILNLYLEEHSLKNCNIEENYIAFLNEYKKCLINSNETNLSEISKKISIYQKAINLIDFSQKKFLEEEKFFLPWQYDFRGRIYFLSDISFTFYKEFRYCMYQGFYENIKYECPIWHVYNNKICSILSKYKKLLLQLKNPKSFTNGYAEDSLIWLLISLGEINKSKFNKKAHITQLIIEGINIYNNYNETKKDFNYEEKIKIISIIRCIDELEENKKIKKRLISKDAPASVFQHLVINFGWKNIETLKNCNLYSEDTWYDTYSYFIENWKKEKITTDEDSKTILNFFNRITLKKVIMTSNYGVGYTSAEEYFKEIIQKSIKKDEGTDLDFIQKNWNKIQILFEDFFDYISNTEILKVPAINVKDIIAKNNGKITSTDAIVDVNYYEKKDYIVDISHEGRRYTKLFKSISGQKDNEKYQIAVRANFIHTLDAGLARWVIKKYALYTIHDCFLIDPINITYLIALVNEAMAQKFHNFNIICSKKEQEIFSIFILL